MTNDLLASLQAKDPTPSTPDLPDSMPDNVKQLIRDGKVSDASGLIAHYQAQETAKAPPVAPPVEPDPRPTEDKAPKRRGRPKSEKAPKGDAIKVLTACASGGLSPEHAASYLALLTEITK